LIDRLENFQLNKLKNMLFGNKKSPRFSSVLGTEAELAVVFDL